MPVGAGRGMNRLAAEPGSGPTRDAGPLRSVFRDQSMQIRRGGPRVFVRKVGALARYGINSLWAVPAVLVLRGISRWIPVRMGSIYAGRIGHFVADPAIYLAQK